MDIDQLENLANMMGNMGGDMEQHDGKGEAKEEKRKRKKEKKAASHDDDDL